MTFHQFIQYHVYRLKAKNRHGIHSPFVYQLIDKCLLTNTHQPLTERLEGYFGKENLLSGTDTRLLNGENVLVVPSIHKDTEATKQWDELRAENDVLLSIDLFEVGLLITRPEFKEKQHFVLKTK